MRKLIIVENCEVDFIDENEVYTGETLKANRTVVYQTAEKDLISAITDYQDNFDVDNIVDSNDDFDGECLDSEIVEVKWEVL